MSIDAEREITSIVELIRPPGIEVSPAAIAIATMAINDLDERYGPNSDNPLSFHNAPHSLGHGRRVVQFTNILYPYIPPRYRPKIYDLAIMGPPIHDHMRGFDDLENVRISSQYAVGLVEEKGGPELNTKVFKKRLGDGIKATAAKITEDGDVVQVNIQKGSRDPHKLAMAFGDKHGIAVEGPPRMFRDSVALSDEMHIDLYDFLVYQQVFLRKGLNDWRVRSDIAYYHPNDVDEVYEAMRKPFHGNIVSAHDLAVQLGEREDLRDTVGKLAKRVGPTDAARLGVIIGKALQRRLKH